MFTSDGHTAPTSGSDAVVDMWYSPPARGPVHAFVFLLGILLIASAPAAEVRVATLNCFLLFDPRITPRETDEQEQMTLDQYTRKVGEPDLAGNGVRHCRGPRDRRQGGDQRTRGCGKNVPGFGARH